MLDIVLRGASSFEIRSIQVDICPFVDSIDLCLKSRMD